MSEGRSFTSDFKRFFGRGLAILLPSIVTLWLLFQAFVFVFNTVAEPINRGIRGGVVYVLPRVFEESELPSWFKVTDDQVALRQNRRRLEGLSEVSAAEIRESIRLQQFRDVWSQHWYLDGLGFVVAIILIYLAGVLLGNYLGRQIYGRLEALIARIPGFKQVYPYVKQVVDLIFGENSTLKAFSEVVMVQYPREGLWSIGFVTGSTFQQVRDTTGGESVTVFIPTSPTPMTGFVINTLRRDTVKLDLTIEQALRFIITAGVLTPEHDMPGVKTGKAVRLDRAADSAERADADSREGS